MTTLHVRHITTYTYKRPVGFGEHRVLFRPREGHDQRLVHSELAISPEPSELFWIHDVFNNSVAVARFDAQATELRFEANFAVEQMPQMLPRFRTRRKALTWPLKYDIEDNPDLQPSMRRHYPDEHGEVEKWAQRFTKPDGKTQTGHLLMTMTMAIKESFKYSRRTDPGTQSPIVTLKTRTGTCRDFALLMMEAARSLGFAARFVTGYVYVPSRGSSRNLGGGSTHAWVQIYLPGAGWVEFDPTNGIIGTRDLIRVGIARDPRQAIPLYGTYEGKGDDWLGMNVQVNVTSGDAVAVAAAMPTRAQG
jgi:transglutaminase-like putative cysteine protease